MPLSKIQTDILRLLAAHRDPESYVAGATPLSRNTSRYSSDIDVFHDREERVALVKSDEEPFMVFSVVAPHQKRVANFTETKDADILVERSVNRRRYARQVLGLQQLKDFGDARFQWSQQVHRPLVR